MRRLVAGRRGLEIGGPTAHFTADGLLPLYPVVERVDNCNFSSRTIWEGAIEAGPTFVYDPARAPGTQYILEASELTSIPSGRYGVVVSSHTLEHSANPVKALREWTRVLEAGGILILVLPHKDGTFDHKRPVTALAHLIEDDTNGTTEHDLTHLPEILALHDLALDPPAGDLEAFTARSRKNFENRCLHHHVFDTGLAVEVVNLLGLEIVAVEPVEPHHIFIVARKRADAEGADNRAFLGAGAAYRSTSPFATDRA